MHDIDGTAKDHKKKKKKKTKTNLSTKAKNMNSLIHWSYDAIISLMEKVHEQKKKISASSITACAVVMISWFRKASGSTCECDQIGSRIAVKPGKTEASLALAIASVTVALLVYEG